MARYGFGLTTTSVPTTTRPPFGLYNTAAVVAQLREAGVSNTSSTACAFNVSLLTATGTTTAQTEQKHRDLTPAPTCQVVTWSADPTVGSSLGYRQQLGAAVGAGVIWTFGGDGLQAPVGVANGLAVAANSTSQNVECYIVWDE